MSFSIRDVEAHKRIDALEKQVANSGPGEATQQNFTVIDPATGLVTFNFTGVINAQGLILPAGTVTTPPNVDRIIWQRTSDGANVAEIWADEAGGTAELVLRVDQPTGGDVAQIVASVTGASPTIIDSNNRSGFVQLTGTAARRFLQAGSVSLTIPLNTNAVSSAVTFSSPFTTLVRVVSNADSANNNIAFSANSVTTSGFTARAWWSDGTATHAATGVTFYWIAFGD